MIVNFARSVRLRVLVCMFVRKAHDVARTACKTIGDRVSVDCTTRRVLGVYANGFVCVEFVLIWRTIVRDRYFLRQIYFLILIGFIIESICIGSRKLVKCWNFNYELLVKQVSLLISKKKKKKSKQRFCTIKRWQAQVSTGAWQSQISGALNAALFMPRATKYLKKSKSKHTKSLNPTTARTRVCVCEQNNEVDSSDWVTLSRQELDRIIFKPFMALTFPAKETSAVCVLRRRLEVMQPAAHATNDRKAPPPRLIHNCGAGVEGEVLD